MSMARPWALALCLLVPAAWATPFEPREFESPAQEERYKELINELRCLVCQNQNLADSDAELAGDLRREVYKMVTTGSSNDEVVDFMVARYGDFVLYRPPVKTSTLFLWAGPFLLMAGGLLMLVLNVRRRAKAASTSPDLTEQERARLQSLVDSADQDAKGS